MINAASYLDLARKLACAIYYKTPSMWRWGSVEDAVQEGIVILYQAAQEDRFDAERGTFATYLGLRMQLIKDLARHGGLIRSPQCSDTRPAYKEAFAKSIAWAPMQDVQDRDSVSTGLATDVQAKLKNLSEADQALLNRVYQEHESPAAIGRSEGVSPQAIHHRLQRIYAKLHPMLEAYK